ncbi:MAG: class I SAM-dependent methyltransferase [Candidatus Bathyarchaeota archaeon]|nr:class I SAM-dependent methyltransferase [Candidatus Bathyarchaeota archaeon]
MSRLSSAVRRLPFGLGNHFPSKLKAAYRFSVAKLGIKNARLKVDIYDFKKPERIGQVFLAPSDMPISDRLFLYSFIRSVKPQRVLEIGVLGGGSALIMTSAMEDNGVGQMAGIDPAPQVLFDAKRFFGRYHLIKGYSPQAVGSAVEKLGGKVDVALIDGLHTYSQVSADLMGVLPYMANDGYILLHDSFHYGIYCATERFLLENTQVVDCGLLSVSPQLHEDPNVAYGGIRVLRVSSSKGHVLNKLHQAYSAAKLTPPTLDDEILDHDGYACTKIKPCPRCSRKQQQKSSLS